MLYFPNGSYSDINTYTMRNLGPQNRPSHPFTIAGDGPGISVWNAKITNATFLTFRGVLPDMRDIALVSAGGGKNTGIFVTNDTRPVFWYNVVVKGFAGVGADLQGACGGAVHGNFVTCGVGLKMPGYCDGWEGHLRLDGNRVGLQVGGYASAFPTRVSANGTRWHVVGNHNDIGVLIVGGSRGVTIGGYFEYNTNGMVHIGYPAGYSEGLGGGSIDRIGPVEINCMSGRWSTNNATSLYPNWCPGVVVATNCVGLTVRNIGSIGAPDIYLANASAYLTPIIMENYQYGTIGYPDYRLYGSVAYGPGYGVTYKNAHMLWQSRSSTNVVAYMSNGVFVATSVTGTNLYGNGSGITGLNADMLASGTVPLDRLSGLSTNYPIGNGDVLSISNGIIISISRD